jgi:hypothetical protein
MECTDELEDTLTDLRRVNPRLYDVGSKSYSAKLRTNYQFPLKLGHHQLIGVISVIKSPDVTELYSADLDMVRYCRLIN